MGLAKSTVHRYWHS
ncbi:hypothetical protein [Pseudomonas sp. PLMAX]